MHTCTYCGTQFEGFLCPRCRMFAPYEPDYRQQHYTHQPDPYYPPPIQYTPYPTAPPPQAQQPMPSPVQHPPAPPKSKRRKTIGVLAVVAIVLFAAIGSTIFFMAYDPFADAVEIFDGDIVTGSIAGPGVDVLYKIKLEPGEVTKVVLNSTDTNDFDLYIYQNIWFSDRYIITNSATESSNEALDFVAWKSDYYIINVYSYNGSGSYQLEANIIDTVSLDDGNNAMSEADPITSGSTVHSSLNAYYDRDDYYTINVESGKILHAFLEVPVTVNLDFDLYIYGPNGGLLNVSEEAYGNEELFHYAQQTGDYHVRVWAYSGMGNYSLFVEIYDVPGSDTNNDISSAVSIQNGAVIDDTLSEYLDTDDYFKIWAARGQTIHATLSGPANADFDMRLYNSAGSIVAFSEEPLSQESISYVSQNSDYFYLNVYAYQGFGSYRLTVNVGTSVLRADAGMDKTAVVGQSVTFDGSGSGGDIDAYSWNFGDGALGSGKVVTHSYSAPGTYHASLTVSNDTANDTDHVTVTVTESGSGQGRYALVIGISDYLEIRDLTFCDDDARAWTVHLQSQGYTVRTLIDSEATAARIYEEIEWLKSMEVAGDHVAFTFSGHGGYTDRGRYSYICAYDSNSLNWDGDITNNQLGQAFTGFDTSNIFFFFDSCNSGGLDSVAGSGRYVSQTCGQFEYGLESYKYQHGLWTYWFLEYSVRDRGRNEMTSAYSLAYNYAVNDAASMGSEMHPEEEFTGTAFYL